MNTLSGERCGTARRSTLPGRLMRCCDASGGFFQCAKSIAIAQPASLAESKRAESFDAARLRENAFEPVCPPSGQGNGLRYLTLS